MQGDDQTAPATLSLENLQDIKPGKIPMLGSDRSEGLEGSDLEDSLKD